LNGRLRFGFILILGILILGTDGGGDGSSEREFGVAHPVNAIIIHIKLSLNNT